MTKHNRFTRNFAGKSTFKCTVCDRNTRDSGQGVEHLCFECYEIAGLDNTANDEGYAHGTPEHKGIMQVVQPLFDKAVKLGSNGRKIMEANDYLWTAEEAAAYVSAAKAPAAVAPATPAPAAPKARKAAKAPKAAAKPTNKREMLLAMVSRKGGATMAEMLAATGWQACRGTLGIVVAKAGKELVLNKKTGKYSAK